MRRVDIICNEAKEALQHFGVIKDELAIVAATDFLDALDSAQVRTALAPLKEAIAHVEAKLSQ